LLVAHNDDASKNLLRYVKGLCEYLCHAPDAPAKVGDIDRADRISLTNGSVIKAIPGGNPKAIRSHGGAVWFDEYAYHRDQEENYRAADPVIFQHEGVFRIVSSPFSDGDLFWRIWRNEDDKYSDWGRHKITLQDAIDGGLKTRKGNPIDIEAIRRGQPDEDAWNAEYNCIPLSDAQSYWPWVVLNKCRGVVPVLTGSRYGGFDVARSANGDLAALAECIRDDDRYGLSKTIWAERGVDFESMQAGVLREFRERKWERMAIDASGLGLETAERIQRKLTTARVDAVKFTPQSKSDMATTARALADEGKLWIDDDRELLLDLHSIKRIVGDNSVKYDAERNERGHADRAWAAFLAIHAAGRPIREIDVSAFQQTRRARSRKKNWRG
jgi:phage FluMu gp28-like protein